MKFLQLQRRGSMNNFSISKNELYQFTLKNQKDIGSKNRSRVVKAIPMDKV
jgi:hypothetical protein